MTVSLVDVKPANGSTVYTAHPAFEIGIFSDTSDDYLVNVVMKLSRTPTPFTDPAAITMTTQGRVSFYGYAGTTPIGLSLPFDGDLQPGVWYVQASVTLESDGTTVNNNPSPVNQFTISVVPYVSPGSPYPGEMHPFVNQESNLRLDWNYAGSGAQSAYQVRVRRASDNAVVHDSNKVTSNSKSTFVTVSSTYKDVPLIWDMRVWDSWDSASPWSATREFTLGERPTVAVTAPTHNQTVPSTIPSVTLTLGTSGGRKVDYVRVRAEESNGSIAWEKVFTNSAGWANAAVVTLSDSSERLLAGRTYNYRVTVRDTSGLSSAEAVRTFSITMPVPGVPGVPTASDTQYGTNGVVEVTWLDQNRSIKFFAWIIERNDSLIDPNTKTVLSTGEWKEVGRHYGTGATRTFHDAFAPSNYGVQYRIRQVSFEDGVQSVGAPTAASPMIYPVAESYWLIAGTNGDPQIDMLQLHNVTGDNFIRETEVAEYNIMNRGRYREVGSTLGVKGTLDFKLRNTDGTTARQKRLELLAFQDQHHVATLRTPFGDEYRVGLGDVSVTRLAGTGADEFVDVQVPYSEVVS